MTPSLLTRFEGNFLMNNSTDLLAALREARCRRDAADRDIRRLIAQARELTYPRPYTLACLAQAAGMSISGVRTAYTPADVEHARQVPHDSH